MSSTALERLAVALAAAVLLCSCSGMPRREPLYVQLGGEAGITNVISRMLDRVAADPRTARSFKGVRLSYLKKSVSAYICKIADGPCVYEGETMVNAHADLDNTGSEFDVLVQTLREELDAAGVGNAAKNELLRRLAPSRRDIVRGTE
ncbi:MAG: group 1 truncated hemoglobin [Aquabacterium sp.]|nr:MAG: group 1 truncated hemoglobin [Aquabacterium sp.]